MGNLLPKVNVIKGKEVTAFSFSWFKWRVDKIGFSSGTGLIQFKNFCILKTPKGRMMPKIFLSGGWEPFFIRGEFQAGKMKRPLNFDKLWRGGNGKIRAREDVRQGGPAIQDTRVRRRSGLLRLQVPTEGSSRFCDRAMQEIQRPDPTAIPTASTTWPGFSV